MIPLPAPLLEQRLLPRGKSCSENGIAWELKAIMLKKAGGCLGPWVRLGLYLELFGKDGVLMDDSWSPAKLMGLFDWPLGSRVLLVLLRWSLLALSSLALCQIFVKKSLRISASVSASYSPPVESTSISNIAPDTRHACARSSPHYA